MIYCSFLERQRKREETISRVFVFTQAILMVVGVLLIGFMVVDIIDMYKAKIWIRY